MSMWLDIKTSSIGLTSYQPIRLAVPFALWRTMFQWLRFPGNMAHHSEFLFRVPFLVLLEWLLCLDVKQYSDWSPYGRIMQLLGKFSLRYTWCFKLVYAMFWWLLRLVFCCSTYHGPKYRTCYIFLLSFHVILGMLLNELLNDRWEQMISFAM